MNGIELVNDISTHVAELRISEEAKAGVKRIFDETAGLTRPVTVCFPSQQDLLKANKSEGSKIFDEVIAVISRLPQRFNGAGSSLYVRVLPGSLSSGDIIFVATEKPAKELRAMDKATKVNFDLSDFKPAGA